MSFIDSNSALWPIMQNECKLTLQSEYGLHIEANGFGVVNESDKVPYVTSSVVQSGTEFNKRFKLAETKVDYIHLLKLVTDARLNRPKLQYPFTYAEWLDHPDTKEKIEWCTQVGDEIEEQRRLNKTNNQ